MTTEPKICSACQAQIPVGEEFCPRCTREYAPSLWRTLKNASVFGAFDPWLNAATSGIITGIVFAIIRHNDLGIAGYMVLALVYGWWILSFGFNWSQRTLATVLMFLVGLYGLDILRWIEHIES